MTAHMMVPSLITTPILVVSVIFPLLALISILFRYKARRIARQPLQADDWWIVASWVGEDPIRETERELTSRGLFDVLEHQLLGLWRYIGD